VEYQVFQLILSNNYLKPFDIFSSYIAAMPTTNPNKNDTELRIVFHVDLDSFFALVEVSEKPELKGLPVVVGADPKRGKRRGVVCACSYEAREYGIHSATPVSQAYNYARCSLFACEHKALRTGFG
jgi:DNA polymerase IV (DinB-like DNA polymerase)